MQRKIAFLVFLVLLGACASGYFTWSLTDSLCNYFPLSARANAQVTAWEVKEIDQKFAIRAIYSFSCRGKIWTGASFLQGPRYLNEDAAVTSLRERVKQASWMVWFNPDKPVQSSLEKTFPWNLLLRTILCYCVLVYFGFIFRFVL